ncbi:hypothetical protein HAX54_005368, partial [Datura stramonium]|nr:hypothetical protein [Datura stramonium]
LDDGVPSGNRQSCPARRRMKCRFRCKALGHCHRPVFYLHFTGRDRLFAGVAS